MRLATVWLGGCSGCHMSFLDLDEWLIDLAKMEIIDTFAASRKARSGPESMTFFENLPAK